MGKNAPHKYSPARCRRYFPGREDRICKTSARNLLLLSVLRIHSSKIPLVTKNLLGAFIAALWFLSFSV